MWNTLRQPLLALSVGLNLAFIAVWLIQWLPASDVGDSDPRSAGPVNPSVPSLLHREIGVSAAQWRQIAPLARDFRASARDQRRQIQALRNQLLDLLAMPEVDEAAIAATQEAILTHQRQMQNMVIDHLLMQKRLLSPEQAQRLMRSLREHSRVADGMADGKGLGRVLDEQTDPLPSPMLNPSPKPGQAE